MVDEKTSIGTVVSYDPNPKLLALYLSGNLPYTSIFSGLMLDSTVDIKYLLCSRWSKLFEFEIHRLYSPLEDIVSDGSIDFHKGKPYECKGFSYTNTILLIGSQWISGNKLAKFRPYDGPMNHPNLDFPHACPKCGGPAYVGFSAIDCKNKCG